MKILRRGTPPQEVVRKFTCRKCSTMFEFETREATYVHDQRDGDFYIINCPVCSEPKSFWKTL